MFLFQSIVPHCVAVSKRYYDSVDYFDYLERKEEKELINNDRRAHEKGISPFFLILLLLHHLVPGKRYFNTKSLRKRIA